MQTIWVVEDDAPIRNGLVRALEDVGVTVRAADSVAALLAIDGTPDLVLLDVNLPDGDGFGVCRALVRQFVGVRVIMLTARSEEIDIVVGLDSGAIDYVTKPFRLAELRARVRAQLRLVDDQATSKAEPTPASNSADVLEVGDVRLDRSQRRVWLSNAELTLRMKEFDLLERLMREPNHVIRREDLMHDVWDEHWFGSTKTLDVHVANLRRRFGELPEDVSRISTIRGVGFRFEGRG